MDVLYTCTSGDLCLDESNIIRVKPHNPYGRSCHAELEDIFFECGYKRVEPCVSIGIAYKFDGKSLEELKQDLRKRAERNRRQRERGDDSWERWKKHRDHMTDAVIGIDKKIDDFQSGFNVFVLMNSRLTRKEQADFIRSNKKDFIAFVVGEVKRKKKYAELLPFCRISEVTVTNRNEAIVTFELKEKLQDVLKACD